MNITFSRSQSKQRPDPKKDNHQASFYAKTFFNLNLLRSHLEGFIPFNLAELLESSSTDQQPGYGIFPIPLTQRLVNLDYGKGSLRLGAGSWWRDGSCCCQRHVQVVWRTESLPSQHLSSTLRQLKVIDNQSIEK